jgi:glypican 4
MACVANHMAELRPFGDAPHKLSLQVKRSFVATRTFAQALAVAADVAANMAEVTPPTDCSHALTRMTGCNVCQGRTAAKACSGFCTNVMRGCLAYHSELDTEWNSFVGQFIGPFKINLFS